MTRNTRKFHRKNSVYVDVQRHFLWNERQWRRMLGKCRSRQSTCKEVWCWTMVKLDHFMQKLVVKTLFQEMMDHHNRKDGFRETRKLDPYWKLRPVACMVKTELRSSIWSLSEDNTQSCVTISHGSNKFVIDSNNNNTESPEDLPEEQASQLKVKDFAARSEAKAKPQRREPVDYSQSIIPMNEKSGLILKQEILLSLRTRFRRK